MNSSIVNISTTVNYPAVHKHLQAASLILLTVSAVALAIIFTLSTPFATTQHIILFAIPTSLGALSLTTLVLGHFLKPKERLEDLVEEKRRSLGGIIEEVIVAEKGLEIPKRTKESTDTQEEATPTAAYLEPEVPIVEKHNESIVDSQAPTSPIIKEETPPILPPVVSPEDPLVEAETPTSPLITPLDEEQKKPVQQEETQPIVPDSSAAATEIIISSNAPAFEPATIQTLSFQQLMEKLVKPLATEVQDLLIAFLEAHATVHGKTLASKDSESIKKLFDELWSFLEKIMNNESFVLKNFVFSLCHVASKNKIFRRLNYAISFGDETAKQEILTKLESRNELFSLIGEMRKTKSVVAAEAKEKWTTFVSTFIAYLEKQVTIYPADPALDGLKRDLLKLLKDNLTRNENGTVRYTLFTNGVDEEWLAKINNILKAENGKERDLNDSFYPLIELIYSRVNKVVKPSSFTTIFDNLMSYIVEKSDDSEAITKFMTTQLSFLKREVDIYISALKAYFNPTTRSDKTRQIREIQTLILTWENINPTNDLEYNLQYQNILSLQQRVNALLKDDKIAIIALDSNKSLVNSTLLDLAYPFVKPEERVPKFSSFQKNIWKVLGNDASIQSDISSLEKELCKRIYFIPCEKPSFPLMKMKKLENTVKSKILSGALFVATALIDKLKKSFNLPIPTTLPGLDQNLNKEWNRLITNFIPLISTAGYDLLEGSDKEFKDKFFKILDLSGLIIKNTLEEIVKKKPIEAEVMKNNVLLMFKNIINNFQTK